MQRFEFYKSIYDRENLRRESLSNSVNIPIGILTAIFTALIFLLSSYRGENPLINIVFYTSICLSFIFCGISIIFLIKSFNLFYKGHKYKEIPLLRVIEDYHLKLKEYYKKDDEKVENEFENFLISEIITYTDINTQLNDCRSFDLYKAKKFIFFSLLTFAFACIPYVKEYSSNYIKSHKKIETVDNKETFFNDTICINPNINLKKKKMSKNQTGGKTPPPKPPTGNGRIVLGDIKPSVVKSTNKGTETKRK